MIKHSVPIFSRYGLFSVPTLLVGMASCFDLHGVLNTSGYLTTPAEADCLEIESDWLSVGNDISTSIESYEKSDVKAA